MKKTKKCILNLKDINLISIGNDDFQFGYELWKLTQKEFLIKIKGEWNDESEIEFYMDETKRNIENNYLIKYNENNVGWLEYVICKEYIFLKQIHILPQYQGKGIGSIIINEIIKYGIKKRKDIYLEVLQFNIKALEYYKKRGFYEYRESSLSKDLLYEVKNKKNI
ncbi:MAG: GNAT family N-acetyltransferase, partial [Treponema sp.]|nr:GNAT family N-acetyltransferase [Treponema sp.]